MKVKETLIRLNDDRFLTEVLIGTAARSEGVPERLDLTRDFGSGGILF